MQCFFFKAMSNQHNFSKIITPFVQKRKTGCPVKKETKNEILNSTTTFGGGIYSRTVKVYSFI